VKKQITLFILLAIMSANAFGKVVIRGKIRNYDGKSSVYYQPTIEGIYTPYWKEVKPTTTGVFIIEFENTGIGTTIVGYKGIRYRFLIETDTKIYFEFDQRVIDYSKIKPGIDRFVFADSLKRVATLQISGDFDKINQFYNQNLRTSYTTTRSVNGNYYSKLLYAADTPGQVLHLVDSLATIELNQINSLARQLDPENPSVQRSQNEIRSFLTKEVYAFYGSVLLNSMFLKRKEHVTALRKDSSANPDIYNRNWEELIENLAVESKNMPAQTASPDYNDFVESLANTLKGYRQYEFPQYSVTLDDVVIDLLFKYDTILISDPKSRYAYELSGLQRFLNDQLFYSPALLHAVYDLQRKYPKSAHLEFYKPQIEKLEANLETSQREFGNGKIISSNYTSLKDLLKRFEGKNVLIDIWATWCHPCIEDFKYKSSIQPFRDSLQLEVLYISIDKPEWDDRWRQSIKINQLEGHHFRANNKFINDMWSTIGDLQGAIPRYVLIDKNGSIFKSTATRPSAGNALSSEIAELVKKAE
jgi:thiol-disulfide isomerase/thioredoxin